MIRIKSLKQGELIFCADITTSNKSDYKLQLKEGVTNHKVNAVTQ